MLYVLMVLGIEREPNYLKSTIHHQYTNTMGNAGIQIALVVLLTTCPVKELIQQSLHLQWMRPIRALDNDNTPRDNA